MTGAVISRGLTVVATVWVARILGKSAFGELGIIRSTVGMFGVFAGFGLGVTATKHVAEFREKDPERAGRIIALAWVVTVVTGGLMASGLLVFAPFLAIHTINAPHLAGVLRVAALILLINALNGAQTGALSGFEAFRTIAHINLFVGLASFPILITGSYWGGLSGAVWALAINLSIHWLLNHLALRKEARTYRVPLKFCCCRQELPILWRFSLPAVLAGAMVGPVNWAIRALLTNQPDGYEQMGTLSASLVFQSLLLFVSHMLSQPLMSMVSNAGPQMSSHLGIVNMLANWILGVGFAIPLLCFPEIAEWVLGPSYATHDFRITLSLVVFCTSIMTYKAGLARVLAANGLMWWAFLSNSFWAVILILSALLLVDYGAAGLAASLTIAYLLNTVIMVPLYYLRKLVPKGTLVSLESILVWTALIFLVLLNIVDASLPWRIAAFVSSLLIAAWAFKRIVAAETASSPTESWGAPLR